MRTSMTGWTEKEMSVSRQCPLRGPVCDVQRDSEWFADKVSSSKSSSMSSAMKEKSRLYMASSSVFWLTADWEDSAITTQM
jgi:hypothetical protein